MKKLDKENGMTEIELDLKRADSILMQSHFGAA